MLNAASRWLAMAAVVAAWGCASEVAERQAEVEPAAERIVIDGCVERRDDAPIYLIRMTPGVDATLPGAASAAGSPDASSGQTVHLREAAPAARGGQSTSAGSPWVGSRAYELVAPDPAQLASLAGSRVSATGVLEAVVAPPAGTDQLQAASGARFHRFRADAIAERGRCAVLDPAGTTSPEAAH